MENWELEMWELKSTKMILDHRVVNVIGTKLTQGKSMSAHRA